MALKQAIALTALALASCTGGESQQDITRLNVRTREGLVYSLDITDDDQNAYVVTSQFGRSRLGFYEDEQRNKNDSIVLTPTINLNTRIIKYVGIDRASGILEMHDYATGPFQAHFNPATLRGSIIRSGIHFPVTVSAGNDSISVDQLADNFIRHEQAPIVREGADGSISWYCQEDLVRR